MAVGLLKARLLGAALAAAAFLGPTGCDDSQTHLGRGVVLEVSLKERQVLIDHQELPGLMPAMTMNFAIYDRELLESLRPGDVIDFELTSRRASFFITAATVVGVAELEDGWSRMGDGLVPSDPAPPFELLDVSGETVSLAGLAGRVLLVDFIFTRCPGPCPILTSSHVSVQRLLPQAVREATHFVSISIDPLRDTPADLEAYALARGADLSDWSFLTGPPDEIGKVVEAYGVGTGRSADGQIEHVLATFLVDPRGRIVKRYIGLDHDPAAIVADLEAVVFPLEPSEG